MNEPVKDKHGFPIYKELPEGAEFVSMERLKQGIDPLTPIVIYSEINDEYQCYRITVTTNIEKKVLPFVKLARVWILHPIKNKYKALIKELVLDI